MFDFTNQVVVVTGASNISIGTYIAKHFYDAGAKVAICSSNEEKIMASAEKIAGDDKDRMFAMKCDVTSVEEIRTFANAVKDHYGRIDVWVNNAGVEYTEPSLDVTEEHWDAQFDINVKGYFFCAQAAAKIMMEQGGGNIIMIGSVNKVIVTVGNTAYASTKSAISKMVENLGREWGPEGIRVNCIGPGSIPTMMNKAQYADIRVHEAMCDKLPLKRRGEGDEIADLALYLASPYSSYITGQTIMADGGLSLVSG